jgi:hypothetical protein
VPHLELAPTDVTLGQLPTSIDAAPGGILEGRNETELHRRGLLPGGWAETLRAPDAAKFLQAADLSSPSCRNAKQVKQRQPLAAASNMSDP